MAPIRSLKALRGAEDACTRCPLYRNATQAVPGIGAARASIMLVGEQPGDQEDQQGKPFVGPAGRVLAEALEAAGISRDECFATNAVKHFKFETRGKRRLHKRPGAYEIDRCHIWLDTEIALVRPKLIVAMGATAVRSVCGKPLAIGKIRGHAIALPDARRMLATVHPSYILRIRDDDDRHAQFRAFVADLKAGARLTNRAA
ncbi:MAG: UdgX family uracil-DNA binding protein [Pseudolabrys sp.]|nr:UdgX family uracil-DNA binding protein [Pseudolabrys sp.]